MGVAPPQFLMPQDPQLVRPDKGATPMQAEWIKFDLNKSLESNLRLHVPASTSSPLSWMYLPLWYPFWWGFTTPFCCSLTSPFCCILLFSNVSTPPCLSPSPFSWISSEIAVVWVSVTTFNDVFDTLAFSCWGYQDSSLKEAIRENYKSLFILHSIVSGSSYIRFDPFWLHWCCSPSTGHAAGKNRSRTFIPVVGAIPIVVIDTNGAVCLQCDQLRGISSNACINDQTWSMFMLN